MMANRGFTLIELMVSMVIGSILLLAAAAFLRGSGEGYERLNGGVALEREARAAIAQLGSDLATAEFHKNGMMEKSTADWTADRIGFLCLKPADAQTGDKQIGDLCAVNYYLRDLTMGGKSVRCLMRGFRDSADTFNALRDASVESLFTPRPEMDEPIACGVVSFEARPKVRDADGVWVDWVAHDAGGPEAMELRLILVRRSLMGRLRDPADWDGTRVPGLPDNADCNKDLVIYRATLRYGHHESP